MIIGIDATNIISGGGVTHLVELFRNLDPAKHLFKKVIIWAPQSTLDRLMDCPWLIKHSKNLLGSKYLFRVLWQWRYLGKLAKKENCSLLFVPGGLVLTSFRPIVTMNQNLLPFSWREILRYGCSLMTFRLIMLRWLHTLSISHADGVIFLTKNAIDTVLNVTGKLHGSTCCIPHGVNSNFQSKPVPQRRITNYSGQYPFRLLYVSTIDQYKHQWNVVEAASILRDKGISVILELVGDNYHPALEKLEDSLDKFDPGRNWVQYHGLVNSTEIQEKYMNADVGIFASTCETFGIILLEMMNSWLPVACSNCGPMPEILQDAGVYFDPEKPTDIAQALEQLILSSSLRKENAEKASILVRQYSWERCADETFEFLSTITHQKE